MNTNRRPSQLAPPGDRHDQNRYRASFQQAAIAIAHTLRDGRIIDVNEAFCAMIGYGPGDLLGTCLFALQADAEPGCVPEENYVRELFCGELSAHSRVERYRRRDGSLVRVQQTVSLSRSETSREAFLIHFMQDVTAQCDAEAAQRAADLRFHRLLETALECIVTTDHEGRIVEFNAMAERVFRYPRADVLGRRLVDVLVPPHLRRRHEASMKRLLTRAQASMLNRRIETIALRGDGTTIPVELLMQRITDADPPLFTGFLRDISERKETEARILRLNRLYRTLSHTSALIMRAADRRSLFTGICRIAREHGGFILPSVQMLDQQEGSLEGVAVDHGVPTASRVAEVAASATAVRERRVVICNDLPVEPAQFASAAGCNEEAVGSFAALPLVMKGEALGVLHLRAALPGYFDEDIRRLLEEMVAELTYALERLELEAEHRRTLAALSESDDRFRQLAENIPQMFWLADPDLRTAFYVSAACDKLTGRPAAGPQERHETWLSSIHPDDRERVLHARRTRAPTGNYDIDYRIVDVAGGVRWVNDRAFPIRESDGRIARIAGIASDITESRHSQERLTHLARHDQLTNLPNRSVFYEHLTHGIAHAERHRQIVGVILLDLDRFKTVNDTLGHTTGDALLRQIAERLSDCVRGEDTVSRLSGDEFAIVLAKLANAEDAGLVAAKILQRLQHPFDVDGVEVVVSASIGITLYPSDATNADDLIRNADIAMYNAKSRGRENYQFYTAEMNERALGRVQLESRLRGALERDEFILHFQPKIMLDSGVICGFEALIRWQPPNEPLVPPAVFIPVLEETGLITPVGEWVVQAACRQIAAWREAGLTPVPVAINLSARQLRHAGFSSAVSRTLKEYGIDAKLLEVEITESSLMENPEEAQIALAELKEIGVTLAIDDFGTGYSSLAYLKRFPFDTLKIDRSFVRDIPGDSDDATISRTIIALAHSLSLDVVAEGVETEEQLAFLLVNRCDLAQGFLFAKPVPGPASTALLAARKPLYAHIARAALEEPPAVLVLDDELNDLTLVQQLLQREDCRVLVATSPKEAFDVLATHNVVVVVSDERMPEMSGVEFFSRVQRSHPHVVRIMMSGFNDPATVVAAINEGAVHKYFVKGRDEELLRQTVWKTVRQSPPLEPGGRKLA